MGIVNIGIGEWAVSGSVDDVLKTYALGSCVAVVIYDASLRIAGMIHVALPDSAMAPDRALTSPGSFANLGLPLMIEEMKGMGVTRAHVWVKIAGGATRVDLGNIFDIGKRNVLAVKKVLWRSSLGPLAEDTGGDSSRTVSVSVASGSVELSSGNRQWAL